MTLAATGALSNPFGGLALLLASSATFQSVMGFPGDAASALAVIDFPYRDIEADGFRCPGAIISDSDDLTQTMTRMGQQAGELELSFFLPPNPDYATDQKSDLIDLRNTLSSILAEMLANARNAVGDGTYYWNMEKWRKRQTPTILRPNQMNGLTTPIRCASFVLEWN